MAVLYCVPKHFVFWIYWFISRDFTGDVIPWKVAGLGQTQQVADQWSVSSSVAASALILPKTFSHTLWTAVSNHKIKAALDTKRQKGKIKTFDTVFMDWWRNTLEQWWCSVEKKTSTNSILTKLMAVQEILFTVKWTFGPKQDRGNTPEERLRAQRQSSAAGSDSYACITLPVWPFQMINTFWHTHCSLLFWRVLTTTEPTDEEEDGEQREKACFE